MTDTTKVDVQIEPANVFTHYIPLRIIGEDGRTLFQVNSDGTAIGVTADMSEAARVFAKHVGVLSRKPEGVRE